MEKKKFLERCREIRRDHGPGRNPFDVLGFYVQNTLLSLLSLVIFVLLLGYLTRRRVERFGARGYSYGQCLGFMVCVMLCAGFIEGAFMGVASNWLFAARYEAMIGPSIAMLENTGFYTGDQIEMMMKLMRSPLVQIFSGIARFGDQGRLFSVCLLLPSPSVIPTFSRKALTNKDG